MRNCQVCGVEIPHDMTMITVDEFGVERTENGSISGFLVEEGVIGDRMEVGVCPNPQCKATIIQKRRPIEEAPVPDVSAE